MSYKKSIVNPISNLPFLLLILLTTIVTNSIAQHDTIFPRGHKAPNVHHTGDVWLNHLSSGDSIFDYNVTVVKMAKGSKLDWHTHPKGQQLLIVEGEGLYQERRKPLQVVRKGDIVKCDPNIEHWHAATPKDGVTYLAITGNEKTVWLESIPEEFYQTINIDSIRNKTIETELIKLSKDKWQWMADKDINTLEHLFLEQAKFVHMGGTWGKKREIEIIKSGGIHYKKADIHETSVEIIGNTAVLMNRITLLAVVGGNEVTNPFMVTEVYIRQDDNSWKLGSLSFTKLLIRE